MQLLTGVNSKMAFETERVTAGVVTEAAQIGPLVRVHTHVPLELAQLNRRVFTGRALVRLLHCVSFFL